MSHKVNALISAILLTSISIVHAADVKSTTTTTTTTSADGTVVKRTITTTVPEPKEVVVAPSGYVTCFTVKGGWDRDNWAAEHDVCSYSNMPDGLVWVQGYWMCDKYDANVGQCNNWNWKKAHWEKTISVY